SGTRIYGLQQTSVRRTLRDHRRRCQALTHSASAMAVLLATPHWRDSALNQSPKFFRTSLPYCATQPPSTTSDVPVVNFASSEQRYKTAAAISSVTPFRPTGIADVI